MPLTASGSEVFDRFEDFHFQDFSKEFDGPCITHSPPTIVLEDILEHGELSIVRTSSASFSNRWTMMPRITANLGPKAHVSPVIRPTPNTLRVGGYGDERVATQCAARVIMYMQHRKLGAEGGSPHPKCLTRQGGALWFLSVHC